MADTFPWQQGTFNMCKGENVGLVLKGRRNFLKTTFEIRFIFYGLHTAVHQLGKLFES